MLRREPARIYSGRGTPEIGTRGMGGGGADQEKHGGRPRLSRRSGVGAPFKDWSCPNSDQVECIRHWKIIEGSYDKAPDIEAHWFIDPPYTNMGKHYAVNGIDYIKLADWCKRRSGYIQVSESADAQWLPFQPFALVNSHRPCRFSAEGLYEIDATGSR
jgi:hypothetical protein